MTNSDIAYDVGLEELYERIRMQIWINEELQLQPKSIQETIINTYREIDR